MSRLIVAFAFLLMASTVSAQATNNVTFWTNSVTCGSGNTTDALAANVTSFQVPNTPSGCFTQQLANGFVINITSWCNNATGEVSVNVYNSSQCDSTPLTTLTSNGCNYGFVNDTFSALVASCPIVSTPTTPAPNTNTTTPTTPAPNTNTTTPAPNGTTTAPPSGTPKPGVAAQAASFSLIAAAAVIVVALL